MQTFITQYVRKKNLNQNKKTRLVLTTSFCTENQENVMRIVEHVSDTRVAILLSPKHWDLRVTINFMHHCTPSRCQVLDPIQISTTNEKSK